MSKAAMLTLPEMDMSPRIGGTKIAAKQAGLMVSTELIYVLKRQTA